MKGDTLIYMKGFLGETKDSTRTVLGIYRVLASTNPVTLVTGYEFPIKVVVPNILVLFHPEKIKTDLTRVRMSPVALNSISTPTSTISATESITGITVP